MVKGRIWQAFCDIEFAYDDQREQPKDAATKEEEGIRRLNELKAKGKLSKKKQKELSRMVSAFKNKKKPKNDELDKKLHKAMRAELKESSAVVSDSKTQRIGRQILLKVFYVCFKVLREFPLTGGFDHCVRAVARHSAKADPAFLKSIVDELKQAFEAFEGPEGARVNKTTKQLLVLHAVIKITNEKSELSRRRPGHRGVLQRAVLLQDPQARRRAAEPRPRGRPGAEGEAAAAGRGPAAQEEDSEPGGAREPPRAVPDHGRPDGGPGVPGRAAHAGQDRVRGGFSSGTRGCSSC